MRVLCIILIVTSIMVNSNQLQSAEPPKEYFLQNVTISLKRTSCFWRCPAYSLTIQGNGLMIYEGHEFVAVKGQWIKRIPTDDVVKLLGQFYNIDFFSLKDQYRYIRYIDVEPNGKVNERVVHAEDLPTTYIRLRINNYEKSVEDYFEAPDGLQQLEQLIHNVSDVATFIGEQ